MQPRFLTRLLAVTAACCCLAVPGSATARNMNLDIDERTVQVLGGRYGIEVWRMGSASSDVVLVFASRRVWLGMSPRTLVWVVAAVGIAAGASVLLFVRRTKC